MAYPVATVHLPSVLNGQANGSLDPAILRPVGGGHRLVAPAAIAWTAMVVKARSMGVDLSLTSSYRSFEEQERIYLERNTTVWLPFAQKSVYNGTTYYLKYGEATVAVPRTSNHGLGIGVDITSVTLYNRLTWLLEWADWFGFSWEIQSEPWHLRYVYGDIAPPGVVDLPSPPAPMPEPTPTPPSTDEDDDMSLTIHEAMPRGDGRTVDFDHLPMDTDNVGPTRVSCFIIVRQLPRENITNIAAQVWCGGEPRDYTLPADGSSVPIPVWRGGWANVVCDAPVRATAREYWFRP